MWIIDLRKKRTWLLLLLALVLLLGPVVLAAYYGNQLLGAVASGPRLLPIYEVATERQAIAISFDASWGAEHTENILDTLDDYGIQTTFFLVNIWVQDYPELAAEIAKRGHEIGLHSVSHPHFSELSTEQMQTELRENFRLIQETTGTSPRLFRPPFGDYNNQVIQTSEELGFQPIQWSVDSLDWKDLSADEICNRVLQDLHAGDIVLFHNNGKHTAEALPRIIAACQEKGLDIVPVSELLLDGETYIDANGVQRKK